MNKIKSIIPLAVLAVIVLAVLYIGFRPVFAWRDNLWLYNVDFDEYESDYDAVIKLLRESFGDGTYRLKYDRENNISYVRVIKENRDTAVTGSISENISRVIASAEGDLTLESVCINGENAAFYMDNEGNHFGGYALVYSPDGKPKYYREADEEGKLYVKNEGGGWYHLRLILEGEALHLR